VGVGVGCCFSRAADIDDRDILIALGGSERRHGTEAGQHKERCESFHLEILR
jgi:hypothetical protein